MHPVKVHTAGDGKGYTLHVHTAVMERDTRCTSILGKGYTLHFHTAGGGKGYTLHVHTAGGGKGYTLHVHTASEEIDTPCTSQLVAMER
jgi:hypothetical protein